MGGRVVYGEKVAWCCVAARCDESGEKWVGAAAAALSRQAHRGLEFAQLAGLPLLVGFFLRFRFRTGHVETVYGESVQIVLVSKFVRFLNRKFVFSVSVVTELKKHEKTDIELP